jgi:SAM-dependent methyltransferase
MKRNCPYCTAREPIPILTNRLVVPTKGAFHSGFDVVECGFCGGVYADGIPDAQTLNDYYAVQSKKAQGYKARDWNEPELWSEFHRETKQWIKANADVKNNILDIGCFTGNLLSMFMNEKSVFGYDPSRLGHDVALLKYGLTTEIASWFRETSYYRSGMTFSLAILSHVVEHIADVDEFFADIRPALDDGGQLYVEVPDITNWFISSDAKNGYDHREPMLQLTGEHINFFSPSSLTRMMNRLGYACVKCESRSGNYALISSLWSAYPKSDDAKYVPKYFADSMAVIERLNAIMWQVQCPVYVWGAGGHTQRMLQYSEMGVMLIEAFIESNTDYHGGMLAWRLIISPSEVNLPYPIIVSSLMYQGAIVEQIKKMGIKNQVITLY